MASSPEHDCTAHLRPEVDDYDAERDAPLLSATMGDEVEVYLQCDVCNRQFQATCEVGEIEPVP